MFYRQFVTKRLRICITVLFSLRRCSNNCG